MKKELQQLYSSIQRKNRFAPVYLNDPTTEEITYAIRLKEQAKSLHETIDVLSCDDESQLFIKRIIGLPGETVEIRDGHIYIDGSSEPLEDVETKEYMVGNYGPYTVPEGCYFCLGDNRPRSEDSRELGAFRRREITGKVLAQFRLSSVK